MESNLSSEFLDELERGAHEIYDQYNLGQLNSPDNLQSSGYRSLDDILATISPQKNPTTFSQMSSLISHNKEEASSSRVLSPRVVRLSDFDISTSTSVSSLSSSTNHNQSSQRNKIPTSRDSGHSRSSKPGAQFPFDSSFEEKIGTSFSENQSQRDQPKFRANDKKNISPHYNSRSHYSSGRNIHRNSKAKDIHGYKKNKNSTESYSSDYYSNREKNTQPYKNTSSFLQISYQPLEPIRRNSNKEFNTPTTIPKQQLSRNPKRKLSFDSSPSKSHVNESCITGLNNSASESPKRVSFKDDQVRKRKHSTEVQKILENICDKMLNLKNDDESLIEILLWIYTWLNKLSNYVGEDKFDDEMEFFPNEMRIISERAYSILDQEVDEREKMICLKILSFLGPNISENVTEELSNYLTIKGYHFIFKEVVRCHFRMGNEGILSLLKVSQDVNGFWETLVLTFLANHPQIIETIIVPFLVEDLRAYQNHRHQSKIIQALARLGKRAVSALPEISEELISGSVNRRLSALAIRNTGESGENLLSLLLSRHANPMVREACARSLSRSPNPEPSLKVLVNVDTKYSQKQTSLELLSFEPLKGYLLMDAQLLVGAVQRVVENEVYSPIPPNFELEDLTESLLHFVEGLQTYGKEALLFHGKGSKKREVHVNIADGNYNNHMANQRNETILKSFQNGFAALDLLNSINESHRQKENNPPIRPSQEDFVEAFSHPSFDHIDKCRVNEKLRQRCRDHKWAMFILDRRYYLHDSKTNHDSREYERNFEPHSQKSNPELESSTQSFLEHSSFEQQKKHKTIWHNETFTALIKGFEDEDYNVREICIKAFSGLNQKQDEGNETNALSDDMMSMVVDALIFSLDDCYPQIRQSALKVLSNYGSQGAPNAGKYILSLLKDEFWKVRLTACVTLRAFVSEFETHHSLPKQLRSILIDGSIPRKEVACTLVCLGSKGEQILLDLVYHSRDTALKSKGPRVRAAAVQGFAFVDLSPSSFSQRIVQTLFRTASKDESVIVRSMAIAVLGVMNRKYRDSIPLIATKSLLPFLYNIMKDSDPNVREAAATVLSSCGAQGELLLIEGALKDSNALIREGSVFGLMYTGARSIRSLLVALEDHAAPVRRRTEITLEHMGAKEIVDTLKQRPPDQIRSVMRYTWSLLKSKKSNSKIFKILHSVVEELNNFLQSIDSDE
eukprot:gb/GECH01009517.1/.p1 GENE.gb/GECH01009517.1/~~gb/GECH01009517.1/.p1  ORF type:complete len:1191 (+),score=248.75 gb/GECH01009517.1/:1-3573(+)